MPMFRVSPELEMHYRVDDFTDPWTKPETVLMLPGNSYHVAASDAERCAQATLEFISRHAAA